MCPSCLMCQGHSRVHLSRRCVVCRVSCVVCRVSCVVWRVACGVWRVVAACTWRHTGQLESCHRRRQPEWKLCVHSRVYTPETEGSSLSRHTAHDGSSVDAPGYAWLQPGDIGLQPLSHRVAGRWQLGRRTEQSTQRQRRQRCPPTGARQCECLLGRGRHRLRRRRRRTQAAHTYVQSRPDVHAAHGTL